MNTSVSLIIITVLLNSQATETSVKKETPAIDVQTTNTPDEEYNDDVKSSSTLDFDLTPYKAYDNGDSIGHKNMTRSTNFLDNLYCDNCIQNTYNGWITNVYINNCRVPLYRSPQNFYMYEGTYLYNDGELINVICANSGNDLPTLITMTYYEWEGNSLQKIFTSTSMDAVHAYIKLLKNNSTYYVLDCEFEISVQPLVFTARLSLHPRESSTIIVKVNDLTLSELCTSEKGPIYYYAYFVNYGEKIFLTMTLDKQKFYGSKYCKVNGSEYPLEWYFSEENSTNNNISLIFDDTLNGLRLDCFAEGYWPSYLHDNLTFQLFYVPYSYLIEKEDIVIEGLQWSNVIGIYSSESSTRTMRYLYHGEELQLKCTAHSIPNWAYNEIIVMAKNNVTKVNKTSDLGKIYSATSNFKVKEFYPKAELSCILSSGQGIVVELIRDETALAIKKSIEPRNKSTEKSSSAVQTITVAVTALLIILVIAFAVFKVLKVRNQKKLEQIQIVYESSNLDNIYESIQYERAKSNKPSVDIRQRAPMPLPSESQKGEPASVDISQRPPLPLPVEDEEDNRPYVHYDTPYEYRLFRFGRRPRPPNRGRTLKRIKY